MAAAGRSDWHSRPPHVYSGSYDSYYPPSDPSYSGTATYYGTPRARGPPPTHQHSPIVTRGSGEGDYSFYNESPHSRSMSPGPPGQSYERPPSSFSPAPYRTARSAASGPPPHRSQVIHRGAPPYSTRGASASAVSTPRAHPPRPYGDSRGFFPDSPYSSRNRQPMGRLVMPLHRQHLPPLPRDAGPAPWEPPSPDESKQKRIRHPEDEFITATASQEEEAEGAKVEKEGSATTEEEEGGDPLALLAKVSSDMETKPGEKLKKKSPEDGKQVSSAPPTSPLTRRTRSSPVITPTTDNTSSTKRKVEINPSFPEVPAPPRAGAPKGPKAVTPMPPYYPPYGEDRPHGPPPHHYSGPPPSRNAPGYRPYPPPHHHRGMPPGWHREGELPPPGSHPAVVERHSFDSIDSNGSHESGSHPHRRFYGPPPPTTSGYGPPPSPRHRPPHSMPGPPPGQPYPPRYMGYNGPPPPHGQGDPYGMSPYSYVQQPHLEEKTVLRRKFSWKHYPELERFLIANRDDYLEHSSKNYTAEQKQYNNWLTERLLQVAEQHNYVFDPDDFNFVAIRDRIRCYYKSYVQTARKRGLELPGKAHIKKHRPTNSLDKYAEEKDKKLREEQEKKAKGEKVDGNDDEEDTNDAKNDEEPKQASVKEETSPPAAIPVKQEGGDATKKDGKVELESK